MLSLHERIEALSMPEPNTGCWIWLGATVGRYGSLTIGRRGKDRRSILAHRLSYGLYVADPGDGYVCHRCDTPACVNPNHLFLGSQTENMADMKAKGRGRKPLRKTHCIHGHEFPANHPPRRGCPRCKSLWRDQHYQANANRLKAQARARYQQKRSSK